jgi:hypothetical protein
MSDIRIFQKPPTEELLPGGVMNRYVAPPGVLPNNVKRAAACVALDVKASAFRTTNEKILLVKPANRQVGSVV